MVSQVKRMIGLPLAAKRSLSCDVVLAAYPRAEKASGDHPFFLRIPKRQVRPGVFD